MTIITTEDGLLTRAVPEIKDLIEWRSWHISAGNDEPVFILSPQTFTDFAATLGEDYISVSHPELGEGLAFALPGIPNVPVYPDESVDEGVIEVVRERFV